LLPSSKHNQRIFPGARNIVRRLVTALLLLCATPVPLLADTFTFSAPPKLNAHQSRSLYAPLAALLSSETGETIEYLHPPSWFEYQIDMRQGRFDLVLDDAHFAAWRMDALNHQPLVSAKERIRFVVVATEAGRVYSKEDLIGQPVCAAPLPDLGTISLLRIFGGLFQVPRILETLDPLARVERLLAGDCTGVFLARHEYMGTEAISRLNGELSIIAQTDPYPGLTLTIAASVPNDLKIQVRRLFLSRKGGQVTQGIRNRFANGSNFVEAVAGDYQGLASLVESYPGFDIDAD